MNHATQAIASETTKALRRFLVIVTGGAGAAGVLWLIYEIVDLIQRINEQGVAQTLLR